MWGFFPRWYQKKRKVTQNLFVCRRRWVEEKGGGGKTGDGKNVREFK